MKLRFSMLRLLLLVPILATPLVMFRESGPVVASAIGAAMAGACLFSKPNEFRSILLPLFAYVAIFYVGHSWLTYGVDLDFIEGATTLILFVGGAFFLVSLLRYHSGGIEQEAE